MFYLFNNQLKNLKFEVHIKRQKFIYLWLSVRGLCELSSYVLLLKCFRLCECETGRPEYHLTGAATHT